MAAQQSEMLRMMLEKYLVFHQDSPSAGILSTTNSLLLKGTSIW